MPKCGSRLGKKWQKRLFSHQPPCNLSLFHINCCSLNKNFEDLEYLLKATNKTFDVIAISESRILKDTNLSKNINIYNYSVEFTPTESYAAGTLVYINNELSYKLRQDLCISKSSELGSTFIEIINPKKTNVIIGCICRHPAMNLNEFNDNYLNIIAKRNMFFFLVILM